ncbi:hypothetical protein O6H91_Y091700 [Diphasiastrum complanatum]|nr:hypothetical protein O6H91_Y091700 [Diphasiastrum complanatum]
MSSRSCAIDVELADRKRIATSIKHASIEAAGATCYKDSCCKYKLVYVKNRRDCSGHIPLEKIMNHLGWYATQSAEFPGWLEYKYYRHGKWNVVVESRAKLPYPNFENSPRDVLENFANAVNSREKETIFSIQEVSPKEADAIEKPAAFFSDKCNRIMQQLADEIVKGKGPTELFIPRCRFTWQLRQTLTRNPNASDR